MLQCWLSSSSKFWSCHHTQHWKVLILHPLRLIMKDFFINKSQIDKWLSPKLVVIKTQLKTSIVHTFNNWHASCTWNFKDLPASIYSSLIKIPEQATNYDTYQISHKHFLKMLTDHFVWMSVVLLKFWSRKANNRKVTFHNTHCPLKSWNTRTSNFWTICI